MINPSNIDISTLPSVPLEDRSQLPQTPCIYFAIDSQSVIQYIGKSINPRQRWSLHSCRKPLERMGGVKISYFQCSLELLDEIELCLIDWFQPPLNRQGIKQFRQKQGVRVRQIKEIEIEGLGERIKKARLDSKKPLDKICEEVGVSRTYWYDLEKETLKGTLSIENVRKIEESLKTNAMRELQFWSVDEQRSLPTPRRQKLMEISEKPILFSGAMVRAILNGTKTQTRRLQGLDRVNQSPDNWQFLGIAIEPKKKDHVSTAKFCHKDGEEVAIACPYGKPGDLLWIRETWRPISWGEDFDWMRIEYAATQHLVGSGQSNMTKQINPEDVWDGFEKECVWEKLADECIKAGCLEESGSFRLEDENGKFPIKWRPSIFMFRAMSRLSVGIVDIRVERLQSIFEEDAIAEGIERSPVHCELWRTYQKDDDAHTAFPTMSYKSLWDSINKKSYPWEVNPWVWTVEFKEAK